MARRGCRFLHNLLLHHGRRSYWRLTLMVSYFFYKNVFITTVLFWHQFFAGFSGQRLFDDYFQVRPHAAFLVGFVHAADRKATGNSAGAVQHGVL